MTLPKGWMSAKLGDAVELKYGRSLPERARVAGAVPVYGSNGIVGTHSEPLTSGPAVIVGRKGSAGKVHQSSAPCYPIDTTYYIDDFLVLELGYTVQLLTSLRLDEIDRATAVPGLNREDAYALGIFVPPAAEQRRIVAKLDALTARIARARAELDRVPVLAERMRFSVLDRVFGNEFAIWAAIGRTTAWKEIKEGRLRPVKVCARTIVPMEEAKRWLRSCSTVPNTSDSLVHEFAL